MTTKRFTHTVLMLSGVAMISLSSAAQAGFEWKGPLEPPAAAAEAPAPADSGAMSDLAPVTSGPAPQAAPVANQMSAPAPQAMPPVASQPMTAAASPSGDVLTGFGTDVPLVMALQQIVPPGFQYSFASGVNPGTSVSWEGGKSWQGVLGDMLSKQGLSYALQSNTVVVSVSQSGPAPQMSAMPQENGAPAAAAPAMESQGAAAPAPNGAAPMNIISQPPARDQSSLGGNGMTAMPDNNAPAPAAQAAPAAANANTADASNAQAGEKPREVDIRRKKSPSFFDRLGFTHHDNANSSAQSSSPATAAAAQPAPAAPAAQAQPQQTAAADQPPVMTDMSQSGSQPAPAAETASAQSSAQPSAMASMPGAAGWQGTKGQTLRDVLKSWSDKAGVDLYWSIDYDYRLSDDMTFPGSYDEAVGHLLDKFSAVRPQPYGQLHQGGSGPRVLVIKSYDVAQ